MDWSLPNFPSRNQSLKHGNFRLKLPVNGNVSHLGGHCCCTACTRDLAEYSINALTVLATALRCPNEEMLACSLNSFPLSLWVMATQFLHHVQPSVLFFWSKWNYSKAQEITEKNMAFWSIKMYSLIGKECITRTFYFFYLG